MPSGRALDAASRERNCASRVTDMPRYYFNTSIGDEVLPDLEGEELRDPDHAWEVARVMIQELLREQGDQSLLTASLIVTDESGDVVLEFPFAEALVEQPDLPPKKLH
jgi:hypothetical protein